MMDCDTTGIEPEMALVKQKILVGGGILNQANRLVPQTLELLGYDTTRVESIVAHLQESGSIEGAPDLEPKHLAVFDCAFTPVNGERSIAPQGHLAMMAAVQPFISGAISKTVNMDHQTTAEQIETVYIEAWRLGLKSIAVYRDGCKGSQPMITGASSQGTQTAANDEKASATVRHRLPDERQSLTHKFSIAEHEGYLTVGMYEDNQPGEIFLVMAKEGSTISGLMDAFATAISMALQYGVPLPALVEKFTHTRYEPSGFTKNRRIPYAKSITDYIFRYLASKFLDSEGSLAAGVQPAVEADGSPSAASPSAGPARASQQQDAPACRTCGSLMFRSGSCYSCPSCGATSGCG